MADVRRAGVSVFPIVDVRESMAKIAIPDLSSNGRGLLCRDTSHVGKSVNMIRCCGIDCKDPTQTPPPNAQSSYTVSYNSESHIAVLTQLWGSTYLKVRQVVSITRGVLCSHTSNFRCYLTVSSM